jgi:hypothetical protein
MITTDQAWVFLGGFLTGWAFTLAVTMFSIRRFFRNGGAP